MADAEVKRRSQSEGLQGAVVRPQCERGIDDESSVRCANGGCQSPDSHSAWCHLKLIMERQFNGHGLPTTVLVHPDEALAPKVAGPTIDLQEARRLVTEAKTSGWDGKIRLLCNDLPDRQRAALAVETLLNSIGMSVERTIVTTTELIARGYHEEGLRHRVPVAQPEHRRAVLQPQHLRQQEQHHQLPWSAEPADGCGGQEAAERGVGRRQADRAG